MGFIEKGYLSSSDESVGYITGKYNIYLRIKVPKGTKAANISDLSCLDAKVKF